MLCTGIKGYAKGIRMHILKWNLACEDRCTTNTAAMRAPMQRPGILILTYLLLQPNPEVLNGYLPVSVPTPLTLVMWVVVVVLVVSDVIVCALMSTPGSKSAPRST